MSDTSVPGDALRVTTCDTDETLAAASGLFDQYRHHCGEPPDGDGRTLGWPAWLFGLLAASVPVMAAFVVQQRARLRAGRAPLVEFSVLLGLFLSWMAVRVGRARRSA